MPVGAVMAGGAIAGGMIQSNAASTAAGQEVNALQQADQNTQSIYGSIQNNLTPYSQAGQNALTSGNAYMANNSYLNGTNQFSGASAGVPYANAQGGFSFNASDLQNTPGYQFTLNQGERAVANQQSAEGLGVSGAQQKAMTSYASGLADQTYNQQFNNQLQAYNSSYQNGLNAFNTNYNVASQQYGRYAGLQQQGLSSANTLASTGTQISQQEGNYLTQEGQAEAAGTIGAANAQAGVISGVTGGALSSGGGGGLSGLMGML